MQGKHWVAFAGWLTSLAVQIGGIKGSWEEALTPVFVSGILINTAAFVSALFMKEPRDPEKNTRSTDRPSP